MKTQTFILMLVGLYMMTATSCTVIRPGELGIKQRLGKLKDEPIDEGSKLYNPFTTKIIRMSTRVRSYQAAIHMQTKDGLEVTAQVSLYYHLKPEKAVDFFKRFGKDYQDEVVETALSSRLREGGVAYNATELIAQKATLEADIQAKIETDLVAFGYGVDDLMILDMELPASVLKAISEKVTAEQQSLQASFDIERKQKELQYELDKQKSETEQRIVRQRLDADFAIEKQRKESERMVIEAEAMKQQQEIVNSTLTDKLLKLKSLEITRDLVKSSNAKVIVTDGKSPIWLGDADK